MSKKQTAEAAIYERRQLIRAHESRVLAARRAIEQPEITLRLIEESKRRIERELRLIAQMEAELSDAASVMDDARKSIKRLRKEVELLEHHDKIQKLLELQAGVNKILSGSNTGR